MVKLAVLTVVFLLVTPCEGSTKGCHFDTHMKGKWNFQGQTNKRFIRIRDDQILYKEPGENIIRLRCEERRGNIFLLRRPRYRFARDGVLCVGFARVSDPGVAHSAPKRPEVEYTAIRLNSGTVGGHLMSPQLASPGVVPEIDNTCNDSIGRRIYGFLVRARKGCKFPRKLRKTWSYTYQHARSLTVEARNITLQLLNGNKYVFYCEKRDRNLYVVRTKDLIPGQLDGIMCLEITRLHDDPHYSYQISRINSGEILDNQLRLVLPGQSFLLYQDCDWIDSPGRPEFLYSMRSAA